MIDELTGDTTHDLDDGYFLDFEDLAPIGDVRWHDNAACKGQNPNLFFPKRGDNTTANKAKALCRICPMAYECLLWAVTTGQTSGIFGGFGEDQRRKLRREYRDRGLEPTHTNVRTAVKQMREGPARMTLHRNTPGATCGKQATVNRKCPQIALYGQQCKACQTCSFVTSLSRQHKSNTAKAKAAKAKKGTTR